MNFRFFTFCFVGLLWAAPLDLAYCQTPDDFDGLLQPILSQCQDRNSKIQALAQRNTYVPECIGLLESIVGLQARSLRYIQDSREQFSRQALEAIALALPFPDLPLAPDPSLNLGLESHEEEAALMRIMAFEFMLYDLVSSSGDSAFREEVGRFLNQQRKSLGGLNYDQSVPKEFPESQRLAVELLLNDVVVDRDDSEFTDMVNRVFLDPHATERFYRALSRATAAHGNRAAKEVPDHIFVPAPTEDETTPWAPELDSLVDEKFKAYVGAGDQGGVAFLTGLYRLDPLSFGVASRILEAVRNNDDSDDLLEEGSLELQLLRSLPNAILRLPANISESTFNLRPYAYFFFQLMEMKERGRLFQQISHAIALRFSAYWWSSFEEIFLLSGPAIASAMLGGASQTEDSDLLGEIVRSHLKSLVELRRVSAPIAPPVVNLIHSYFNAGNALWSKEPADKVAAAFRFHWHRAQQDLSVEEAHRALTREHFDVPASDTEDLQPAVETTLKLIDTLAQLALPDIVVTSGIGDGPDYRAVTATFFTKKSIKALIFFFNQYPIYPPKSVVDLLQALINDIDERFSVGSYQRPQVDSQSGRNHEIDSIGEYKRLAETLLAAIRNHWPEWSIDESE